MPMYKQISNEAFDALRRADTCAVANAVERFDVRLRNEGFNDSRLRCRFPEMGSILGYATTLRVKSSSPPPKGHSYLDRTDWWSHMQQIPVPHILVIEDVDEHPGTGAFVGEIHAAILKAFGGVGAITNGAVRDLPGVAKLGFQLFSGSLSASHAYVHVVEFGTPVRVGGLEIRQGDLLHGDQHGVVRVPLEITEQLPDVIAELECREGKITRFCSSPQFSLAGLRELIGSDESQP
jgi:regulator of RNase E activity RraA